MVLRNMFDKIDFIIFNLTLPLVLSVLYSTDMKKYQNNYEITKGVWYLFYGGVVAYDYLINSQSRYVAGFTLCLAIMEGVPLLLKRVFKKNKT